MNMYANVGPNANCSCVHLGYFNVKTFKVFAFFLKLCNPLLKIIICISGMCDITLHAQLTI